MAQTVRESTSAGLSNAYPSYYKEFQVLNWSKSLMVAIDREGNQTILDKCIDSLSQDGKVVVEMRQHNGKRYNANSINRNSKDIEIEGVSIEIPYSDIYAGPVYVPQVDLVIALVEQSSVAVHPAMKEAYDKAVGTFVPPDEIMRGDPTITIAANDPYGRYEELLVYVFGKTMYIPVSHCQSSVVSIDDEPASKQALDDLAKLTLVARYHGVVDDEFTTSVPLINVDNGKPTIFPDGTMIHIATTLEKLQESISNGHDNKLVGFTCNNKNLVPKELLEQEKKLYEAKLQSSKAEYDNKITIMKETYNLEIQKAKNEAEVEHQERLRAEAKVKEWEGINSARSEFSKKDGEVKEQSEKARKEAYAADQKRIERDALIIKIVGSACVAIASFCITMAAKSAKK